MLNEDTKELVSPKWWRAIAILGVLDNIFIGFNDIIIPLMTNCFVDQLIIDIVEIPTVTLSLKQAMLFLIILLKIKSGVRQ